MGKHSWTRTICDYETGSTIVTYEMDGELVDDMKMIIGLDPLRELEKITELEYAVTLSRQQGFVPVELELAEKIMNELPEGGLRGTLENMIILAKKK